jgi:hypothetical protein
MRDVDIAVIGAGAAGIWAAERAAREGAEVVLVEKTPRVGTKILASGGQKCNLTTTRDVSGAERLYGEQGGRWLRHALYTMPPSGIRRRFHELGVPTKTAPLEKVFPVSERAVDVRDALENAAREAGVDIWLESPARGLERLDGTGEAGVHWRVTIEGNQNLRCRKLLVCPGGKSYPGTGTVGDGYWWMESLGLDIVEPVPDLVGLTSDAEWIEELAGVDIQKLKVRITDASGKVLERRRRPVVFTHWGVSGPGAMDLAEHVTRSEDPRALSLDLVPGESHQALKQRFVEAAQESGARGVGSILPDSIPTSVFRAMCSTLGFDGAGLMVDELGAKQRDRLIDALKGWRIPVDGSRGFDHAEVTAGGVSLEEVDPKTMQVRSEDHLYVFGEILNVQGPIGGLNFQAAWSEAEVAATAAVAALKRE